MVTYDIRQQRDYGVLNSFKFTNYDKFWFSIELRSVVNDIIVLI